MSTLTKTLSKRIPLRGDPLAFLPKTLFWKETRQLLPLFFGLLALQVPAYLLLLFTGHHDGTGVGIPLQVLLGLAAGVFAVLGAAFFSSENEDRTGPFLFRMPVSRRTIFWNKIAAALATWAALILASAFLFLIAQYLWPILWNLLRPSATPNALLTIRHRPNDPTGWTWYLFSSALAFLACARFSLRTGNALFAFFGGTGLVVAIQAALLALVSLWDPRGAAHYLILGGTLLNAALCVVLAGNLWRNFRSMEESSSVAASEGAAGLWARLPIFRRQAATLKSIEFREKAFLWGILILLPVTHAFLRPHLYALFWLPFAGIVSGVTLWSRSERDGVGFFLHHQPISKKRLYRQRIVTGLGFNAACLLVTMGFLSLVGLKYGGTILPRRFETAQYSFEGVRLGGELYPIEVLDSVATEIHSRNPWRVAMGLLRLSAVMPNSIGGEFSAAWAFLFGLPIAQFLGFYIGALISPLRRGNFLGVIQTAILTLLIALPTIVMWQMDFWGTVWAVAVIWLGLSLLSGWTNVRSRAMEPGIRKAWRIVGLSAAVVFFAALMNLIDPLDLLYLIGIDAYKWM